MTQEPILTVIARKQEGVVFSGQARSITTMNEKGAFDILPLHENFVSPIKESLEIVSHDGKSLKVAIIRGIIHVKKNQVEIYLGI